VPDWLAGRELTLTLTEPAKDRLAADGYDPLYGARPLKRLIQQQIENPLARHILQGDFVAGDRIVVEPHGDAYEFRK
jgi:ATP-dependent Clp protease ATP-binding subunit ClpB